MRCLSPFLNCSFVIAMFHVCGVMELVHISCMILYRYFLSSGGAYFIISVVMLSFPGDFFFFNSSIASSISSSCGGLCVSGSFVWDGLCDIMDFSFLNCLLCISLRFSRFGLDMFCLFSSSVACLSQSFAISR